MEDLLHSPLFDNIRKYFVNEGTSQKTIFIFAPYIQSNTLSMLLNEADCNVVVVTSWKPKDLLSGASDISVYELLKKYNISLYVNNNLHLKLYSINLTSAILATGNVSQRGLLENGNYELGVKIERLNIKDRLFLENIRQESRLVDEPMYDALSKWITENKQKPTIETHLQDIVPTFNNNPFLISALPMTHSVEELIAGYIQINNGKEPSTDTEISACIFHDLTNYNIKLGMTETDLRQKITDAFFAHPFIQKIDEFISPEAYFGRIKEWVQANCTDVPVPSRRELTGNVQVLLEWFVRLGNGVYKVDIPGSRSQRIRKII